MRSALSFSSYRCSICGVNWPPQERYSECPECHEATSSMIHAHPIDKGEAEDRWKHAQYVAACERRGIEP